MHASISLVYLSFEKPRYALLMAPENNCYLAKQISTVDATLVVWNTEWQILLEEVSML